MVVVRVREHRGAAGQRQQLAAQTEDRTRRHRVLETLCVADREHVRHRRFAPPERLDYGAGVLLGHVDDDVLDRFPAFAVTLGYDDLRL